MLRPISSDTVLTAATTRSVRCRSGINSFNMSLLIRPGSPICSEDPWPWYLPVNTPLESGDHAVNPRFSALAIGISSRSTVRSIKLYSICNPMKGAQPRNCASVFAFANHIIQFSHYLFDRCDLIPDMNPVKIDIVGSEPLETRIHCLPHTLAVVSGCVRVSARSGIGIFRV